MSLSEEFLKFRNDLVKELPTPNILLCCTADRLLILVERQEQELAAMKEPMQEKDVSVSEETFQSLLEKQHSADLREIAEMAIHGCLNWPSHGTWPTADSIVREFCAKQQKAEVKAQ